MIDRTECVAVREVEAELRVVLAGRDELVGVRVHAGGDPQHHAWGRADTRGGQHVEAIEFVEGVDHDVADLGFDRLAEFVAGLVVAVERACAGGHAGRHRHVQFATGGDVEQQTLVVGEAGHRPAQERLGGVDHPLGPERRDRLSAPSSQMGFVVDEQRRAVVLGQRLDRHAADLEPAVVTDRRGVRQQPTRDRDSSRRPRQLDVCVRIRMTRPIRNATQTGSARRNHVCVGFG